MALNDAATLVPAVGHYFFAPTVGQARPADPLNPAAPWVDLGHTSLEEPFGISSEGGDKTTHATWQNKALRDTFAPRVESVTFQLQQWDIDSLKLYYGSNAPVSPSGDLRTPAAPRPTEGSLFVVVEDGTDRVAFYFPHVSVARADDISFDAEALAGLPVAATVLGVSGQDWMFEITPKGLVPVEPAPAEPAAQAARAAQREAAA